MRISVFLKLISILCFISVISTTATANAEEEPIYLANLGIEELMNVHVTSVSKKQELQFDAPAAVYVITGEEIRRMGVRSITDALRIVPGVEVAQINANTTAVSIRGFNSRFSSKLLVLIDGKSKYTPFFSGVFWQGIDARLTLSPVDDMTLLFSYTYLDTEITEDDLFPAGNRLGSIPDQTFNFWAKYGFSDGPLEGLDFTLRLLATSSIEGDNFNSFGIGDYFRMDSVIGYSRHIKEKYNCLLSLNLINITDSEDISFSSSRINMIPAQPFSFFISLKLKYL